MEFRTPEALRIEHEVLRARLEAVSTATGSVGEACRRVSAILNSHFRREEEFALPPLGLLPTLAVGQATPDMLAVLHLTDRLRRELPSLLAEHRRIARALEDLRELAHHARRDDIGSLAEKLLLHARHEEEVAYPAALLVGEVVRARLTPAPVAA